MEHLCLCIVGGDNLHVCAGSSALKGFLVQEVVAENALRHILGTLGRRTSYEAYASVTVCPKVHWMPSSSFYLISVNGSPVHYFFNSFI